jgi:glycosyltransferase involved in cell wall biosynthesis
MGLLVPLSRMAGAAGVAVTEHLPMVDSTWKRRLVKRISFRWVDVVATVCFANVPYLTGKQSVPREKIEVIHNALDRDYGNRVRSGDSAIRGQFGLPDEIPVIVFVGNLLRHKGLHRVINVLCEMTDRPWHLAVVGHGPERNRCERRLGAHGLSGRATFTGKVSGSEVERILSTADLLVLPSSTEGMPYVILEAMASSLPVVATGVYGIPEMVVDGETGILVQTDDTAGLGGALKLLLENPELRKQMGDAARLRFERMFTLDRQLARIETIYARLAGFAPVRSVSDGSD